MITWEQIYTYLGIKEFIYFIASPSIQDTLWPIKVVFIFFSLFFLGAVMWFYVNSSYIQYKFLQNAADLLARDASGKNARGWKRVKRRLDIGTESELKLAMIEADDLLYELLQDAGFTGASFEELLDNSAGKLELDREGILQAHKERNNIVYEADYKINMDVTKKLLGVYEAAIKKAV